MAFWKKNYIPSTATWIFAPKIDLIVKSGSYTIELYILLNYVGMHNITIYLYLIPKLNTQYPYKTQTSI